MEKPAESGHAHATQHDARSNGVMLEQLRERNRAERELAAGVREFVIDSCPLVRARACRGVLVQGGLILTLGWRAVPWQRKLVY